MLKRKIFLGLMVCLLLGTFTRQLLSQGTRPGRFGAMMSRRSRPQRMPGKPDFEKMKDMTPEEKTQYFQQLLEEQRKAMAEQEAIAMQQALGADNEQWKIIEPRLKKVKRYRELAFIGTKPPFQSNFNSFSTSGPGGAGGFGAGFGGGFQVQGGFSGPGGTFQTVRSNQNSEGLISDGEILVEEIEMLLNDPQTTPEQLSQKLDALRIAREKAKRQWITAQQQLREVLDFRQQARLVLMGLLD